MDRYDFIQGIQTRFSDIITSVVDLRTTIVQKGHEPVTADFGGRVAGYSYRLQVFSDCVSFILKDKDLDFFYNHYVYLNNSTENVIVLSNPLMMEFEYGQVADRSVIRLIDVEGTSRIERVIQYPIHEEQYFQYMTAQEMAPESFYDYLMNTSTDYMIGISLFCTDDVYIENMEILLNDVSTINGIINGFKLIESTYRNANNL